MAAPSSTLIIDTVSAACSAALLDAEGTLLAEHHETIERGHAERLMPAIAVLLGDRRPDAILVDCGPGSFTGLRVGLAAAHGLAIGWNVPLSGYSACALLAAMAEADGAPVTAALEGGHGQLFVQSFAGDPLAPADLLQSLSPGDAARASENSLVIGSGAAALVAARGWGEARDLLPRASAALLLPAALRALPARPLYGRAPDAKPMVTA